MSLYQYKKIRVVKKKLLSADYQDFLFFLFLLAPYVMSLRLTKNTLTFNDQIELHLKARLYDSREHWQFVVTNLIKTHKAAPTYAEKRPSLIDVFAVMLAGKTYWPHDYYRLYANQHASIIAGIESLEKRDPELLEAFAYLAPPPIPDEDPDAFDLTLTLKLAFKLPPANYYSAELNAALEAIEDDAELVPAISATLAAATDISLSCENRALLVAIRAYLQYQEEQRNKKPTPSVGLLSVPLRGA